jgi:hypothetical protein
MVGGSYNLRKNSECHAALSKGHISEGAFLPCTFWLADCLARMGRRKQAERIFGSLLQLRNDVRLLSEEYDPQLFRLVGNSPQAFSHVSLINTACNLSQGKSPPMGDKTTRIPHGGLPIRRKMAGRLGFPLCFRGGGGDGC